VSDPEDVIHEGEFVREGPEQRADRLRRNLIKHPTLRPEWRASIQSDSSFVETIMVLVSVVNGLQDEIDEIRQVLAAQSQAQGHHLTMPDDNHEGNDR
jgi:alpha/beta superfamily hydrolase